MEFRVVEHHPRELYGGPVPTAATDFRRLDHLGIRAIVSAYSVPEECLSRLKRYAHLKLEIPDYHAPTLSQVQEFLGFVRRQRAQGNPVFVHCYAGCGRTGTLLAAAELVFYQAGSGEEAIRRVRLREPCSLDSRIQEQFIQDFAVQQAVKG